MSANAVKKIGEWKTVEVDDLADLINNNKVLAVADLRKVRARQIQELRRKFRGEVLFRCTKNNLLDLALKKIKNKPNLMDLKKHVKGSSVYIFTDKSPFKLSVLFEQSKTKMPAKSGDLAPYDIVTPEGNTGLPPGPIISEFTELGIPTRIDTGSVWISSDTVAIRKGEEITGKLASLLSKLGMKPMEVGINLLSAYENGAIYLEDVLKIDFEATKRDLQNAASNALFLAIASAYPDSDTMSILLAKGISEGKALSLKATVLDSEALPAILWTSFTEAATLEKTLTEKQPSLAA